jgi:hypothetical protein
MMFLSNSSLKWEFDEVRMSKDSGSRNFICAPVYVSKLNAIPRLKLFVV